jgi:CheY-like chemotaxis protein
MGMEIALIKDLNPFMKIFINEPTLDAAKQTAMVHAKAAGQADQFSAENKAKFDQFINYMWMAAAKDRAAHQATTVKQAQNPIAFKKWLWDTRPDSKYNAKELAMGTEIEMKEHGIPKILAKKIAKDHLDDIENYYTVLISIKLEKQPNIKANPRRLKKNPETREKYLPPVKKEKPKDEKERVINYADFNPPRLYKQNYQQAKNPSLAFEKLVMPEPLEDNYAAKKIRDKIIGTRIWNGGYLGNDAERAYSKSLRNKENLQAAIDEYNANPPRMKHRQNALGKPRCFSMNTKPKLLVIDDNNINVELNTSFAEKLGFETRAAFQGMEAIALLPWADAVCTDGDYPFRDEFYAALFTSKKPFIINSGNAAKDFKYANHGEIAYVRKPADITPALQLLLIAAKQKKNPRKKSKHKKSCERQKRVHVNRDNKEITKEQIIQNRIEDAWDYWNSYGTKDWDINDEIDLLFSEISDIGELFTNKDITQIKKRLLAQKKKWLKTYSPAEMHVLDEHGRMTKKALDMTLFPKEFNKETIVQSVVFDKFFKPNEAKKWLKHYEFKSGDMDKKPNTLRFRQHPPEHFKNYWTKKLINGVSLVLGTLKKEYPGKYQTFDRKHPLEFGFLDLFDYSKKKK